MMRNVCTVTLLLLAQWHCAATAADQCPAPQSGRFINPDAGYEFTVPTGLKGYWASPCTNVPDGQCTCMGVHGLTMPLTQDSYLSVFSSYAPWREDADKSVSDAAAYISFSTKFDQTAENARFSRQRDAHIKGRTGYYLVEDFRDAKSGIKMREFLYLFVDHKETPHQLIISLRAPAEKIDQFKFRLSELLRSIKWLPSS
jgi:hypothetical protein